MSDYRRIFLDYQKKHLSNYLKMKVAAEDWHAVSDAANDLREVELELRLNAERQIQIQGCCCQCHSQSPDDPRSHQPK